MFLFESDLLERLDTCMTLAREVQSAFAAGAKVTELRARHAALDIAVKDFMSRLPAEIPRTDVERHVHFIGHYLGKGDPESCRADPDDLVARDLPEWRRRIIEWSKASWGLDPDLASAIQPLVDKNQMDSAVRKAFVMLSDRLRVAAGVSGIDGSALVNKVFGREGAAASRFTPDRREAARNLLDGLYGTFRNLYSHGGVEPSRGDALGILLLARVS